MGGVFAEIKYNQELLLCARSCTSLLPYSAHPRETTDKSKEIIKIRENLLPRAQDILVHYYIRSPSNLSLIRVSYSKLTPHPTGWKNNLSCGNSIWTSRAFSKDFISIFFWDDTKIMPSTFGLKCLKKYKIKDV